MRQLFQSALPLLWPTYCLVCQRRTRTMRVCRRCAPPEPIHGDEARCIRCFTAILEDDAPKLCERCKVFPPQFQEMRFLWEFTDQIRDLVHAMKYRPSPALASMLGNLLSKRGVQLFTNSDWDLIVPLPSSLISLRRRGLNQCVYLARAVKRRCFRRRLTGNDLFCLKHLGYREPQAHLEGIRRLRNVRRCFAADAGVVAGKRILLVEDLITSGATTSSAIRTLLQAGADSIDVLALSRSNTWHQFRHRMENYFRIKTPAGCRRTFPPVLS